MNMKKIISSLTAAALGIGAAAFIPEPSAFAEETYRIMAVGDSITDGYINGDNGYRKYLCYYLQQNGIGYDMIGPQNNWTDSTTYDWNGTTITYDPAHCGYSGYSTMSYSGRTGIYETLFGNGNVMETYDPDMILLQIGTNDLLDASLDILENSGDIRATTTALDRLETVVDTILENMDATDVLFVTTVPDIDSATRSDWLSAYGYNYGIDTYNDIEGLTAKVQECVDTYNAGVQSIVMEKQASGKNVQLGDINSVIDISAGDLEDGVHPSEQGYAKMGAHWAETIAAYLNGSGAVVVPPTTEETTETTEATTEDTTAAPDATEATTESGNSNITQGEGNSWTIDVTGASRVIITAQVAANSGANGCIGYYTSDWVQENWEGAADADGNLVYTFDIPDGVTAVQYQIWHPTEVTAIDAELVYGDIETEPTTDATEATTEATTAATEPTTEPTTDSGDDLALGDVNLDGSVNVTDIIALTQHLLDMTPLSGDGFAMADMSEDGVVDAFDLALVKRHVLAYTPMPW